MYEQSVLCADAGSDVSYGVPGPEQFTGGDPSPGFHDVLTGLAVTRAHTGPAAVRCLNGRHCARGIQNHSARFTKRLTPRVQAHLRKRQHQPLRGPPGNGARRHGDLYDALCRRPVRRPADRPLRGQGRTPPTRSPDPGARCAAAHRAPDGESDHVQPEPPLESDTVVTCREP